MIDPDGNRTLFDDSAAGDFELVTVKDPIPGRYKLLVHAYGSSSGPFDLWVDAVDIVEVDAGEPLPPMSTGTTGVAAFEFAAPDVGLLAVSAGGDLELDVNLTVTEPGGGRQYSDMKGTGEQESVLLNVRGPERGGGADDDGGHGRYVAVVQTMDAGRRLVADTFDLSVGPPDPTPVTLGAPAPAEIGDPAAFEVFSFEATDDGPIAVSIPSGADVLGEVEIIDPSGDSTWAANAAGSLLSDLTIVEGDAGTYSVVARGKFGSTGPFELFVSPVDPVDIAVGDSVSGTVGGSGDSAVFELDAPAGESFAVTVEPVPSLDAVLTVRDPSGRWPSRTTPAKM